MTRRDAPSGATPSRAPLSRRAFLAGTTGGAALALAGCSMGTKQMFTGGSSGTTLAVAIVSNSQMQDAISLFNAQQARPWEQLSREANILAGAGGLGGTKTTVSNPYTPSALQAGFGGAAAGAGLGASFGGLPGAGIGAVGGGLLGLLNR